MLSNIAIGVAKENNNKSFNAAFLFPLSCRENTPNENAAGILCAITAPVNVNVRIADCEEIAAPIANPSVNAWILNPNTILEPVK